MNTHCYGNVPYFIYSVFYNNWVADYSSNVVMEYYNVLFTTKEQTIIKMRLYIRPIFSGALIYLCFQTGTLPRIWVFAAYEIHLLVVSVNCNVRSQRLTFAQLSLNFFGVKLPDPLFAVSCLQRSKIAAGMKLHKGGLGVSDLCDTPEEPIFAVEKSLKSH